MKAAILTNPGPIAQQPLRIGDVPQPQPGRGQVLLKIRACGVCRTDLHITEGELPQSIEQTGFGGLPFIIGPTNTCVCCGC